MHKTIASKLLNCGKRKIWIDPNENKNVLFTDSSKYYNYNFFLLIINFQGIVLEN